MNRVAHTYIQTNGIQLHVAQQGPKEGELVLLLHGFPEFWYGWRHQMAALAEAGYHVWAPDQRGYNLSDKPEKVSDYRIEALVEDVAGLVRASGREKVILVGHDWGGIVAWYMARTYPEMIEKLIILNAPHERAMGKQLVQHPFQLLRSSYILFFQLRGLPEKVFQTSGWQAATDALEKTSRPGAFSEADLNQYRKAWSKPGAMRAMLNWYRANMPSLMKPSVPATVKVPTFIIWGAKDQFLGRELAQKSLAYCEDGRGVMLGEATHWLHHEDPERVNRFILAFIAE